jgi:hypothetical protein
MTRLKLLIQLEYDTEMAGGFEPLVHLPKDKVAVLGLVSTKKAEVGFLWPIILFVSLKV